MRVVPGDNMSTLVRQGQEQLAELNKQRDYITKMMVDAAALQMSPQMMCNATPPPNAQIGPSQAGFANAQIKLWHHVVPTGIQPLSQSVETRTLKALLIEQMRNMIPPVVWDNVYRTDEVHIAAEDAELIKLTFYNDRSIKLKVSILGRAHEPDDFDRRITPLCDDFEEWCATAIMLCEAGDDVWERPKPESSSGLMGSASSQQTATQVRAQQLAMQQQLSQAAIGNGLGSFGQGMVQELAAREFNPFGLMK